MPLGDRKEAIARLEAAGLNIILEDGLAKIDEPLPQTPYFEKIGKLFDFYGDDPVVLSQVKEKAERMPKEVFYIPAFLLLGGIFLMQRRRRDSEPA